MQLRVRSRLTVVALAAAALAACRSGAPAAGPGARAVVPRTAPPTATGATVAPPPPPRDPDARLTVRLVRVAPGGGIVSFGVPTPPGLSVDAAAVRVEMAGAPAAALVRPLLPRIGRAGGAEGAAAILVQLPAQTVGGQPVDVEIIWNGGAAVGGGPPPRPYREASVEAPEQVAIARRTLVPDGSGARLVEGPAERRTLFVGREPVVVPLFPAGYLARSGLLGPLVTAEEAARGPAAALAFFSKEAQTFGRAALYAIDYPVNPDAVTDPIADPEAWLYDRCSTLLVLHAHTGDPLFLRAGFRACSHYASQIATDGATPGIFTGKKIPDLKYSHLRGLYAYLALTGDESAAAAARAIAEMWEREPTFVTPYRQGRLRGPDKLWTERLLGAALEGLVYGHLTFGDAKYLAAARELVATAHQHVTGDAAALARLNPGVGPFPPQNCFVHSALQHAEGNAPDPWCSGWMVELAAEALLRYQALTDDPRVDEIFVRLVRFLRDVGTQHFVKNPLGDTFLEPKLCFDPREGPTPRVLVPAYGAGIRADGTRALFGEWDDFEHCADATLLTAAGLRALARQGQSGGPAPAPFRTEAESFLQLHHELAACARFAFRYHDRPRRAPGAWTPAQLRAGLRDPAKFIEGQKIGHPTRAPTPQRKLSWWFNGSLLQFALLAEAGVALPRLEPGRIQPPGCEPAIEPAR